MVTISLQARAGQYEGMCCEEEDAKTSKEKPAELLKPISMPESLGGDLGSASAGINLSDVHTHKEWPE